MTGREKSLVAVVAGVGVLWLGTAGLSRYQAAIDRNSSLQFAAEQALDDAEIAQIRGHRARRKLKDWRAQSLPTNREIAESLYQDWLRSQLTQTGLQVKDLTDKDLRNRADHFTELSIDVTASGNLAQLAEFLYRFYSAPHLHRISAATLTPSDGGQKLDISLTIDALSLPESERPASLADGPPRELPKSMDEVRKALTDRNIFVAYEARRAGDSKERDSESDKAMVTGLASAGEHGWRLTVRTKEGGEVLHFYRGDSIKIGRFEGKVVELDARRAVIETADGRLKVELGQTLGDAEPLDDDAAT